MEACQLPTPIAIDGRAASGKSTVGRLLAERFDYAFLDTGLLYRAFTLAAVGAGVPPEPEACKAFAAALEIHIGDEREARIFVDGKDVTGDLHTPELDRHVSGYSQVPAVRAFMREMQRAFGKRERAILAGRDIGQVILPEAPLKVFLEANEEARARRRSTQRDVRAEDAARQTRADLVRRDRGDTANTFVAKDALVIDTSELSLAEVIERIVEHMACANG